MANHKNQHLLPRVYLKNFIEKKKNENLEYEQGLYISDKNFTEWRIKSTKKKPFSKSNYYTLEDDDKSNPVVEKYLAEIESQYTKVLNNILNKNISKKDLLFISYFTLLQHMRVEKHIDLIQNSMDKVSTMVSDIHGMDIGKEVNEISKRMLLNFGDETESNLVFEQGIHFIENTSEENFIISDNPVVHRMIHIDELQNILGDTVIDYSDYLPNEKLVLFFFPLTLKLALLATKFIVSKSNVTQYLQVSNELVITQLNLLSYQNASEYIYSTGKNPFGEELEKAILEYDNQIEESLYSCQIYTTKNRYNFQLDKYDNFNTDNSFMESYKLYFSNKNNVQQILNDSSLESLKIFEKGKEVCGMLRIELGKYDEKENTLEIHSNIKFFDKETVCT